MPQEICLSNSIMINNFFLILRCIGHDRTSHGGGVMIAIFDRIPSHQLYTHSLQRWNSHHRVNLLSVVFTSSNHPRPLYLSDILLMLDTLPWLWPYHYHSDFNTPHINRNILTGSCSYSSLCTTIHSLNLIQLVHEATHSKGHILDLVLNKFSRQGQQPQSWPAT